MKGNGRRGGANPKYTVAMVAACPFPTSQGSQVLIKGVSKALRRRGHKVHVVTYHHSESGWGQEPFAHRIPTIPTYRKFRAGPSFQKPLLDLLLAMRTGQVVGRERIDLIHAHNYEGLVAGLLVRRMTRRPLVYHAHNFLTNELETYFESRQARRTARSVARFIDGRFPFRADHCIALCSEIAQSLKRCGMAEERCSVIPPGIFAEEFISTLHSGTAVDPHTGSDRRRAPSGTVIYTGNLDDYQGLDLLFASFRRVLMSVPSARLRIVSNSDPREMRGLAAHLRVDHRCEFVRPGTFQEVLGLLSRSDVAVIPRTNSTGFPIKLLNCMAAGVPVVACAGSAKGMTHMETGYLVEDGDEEGFSRGIITLLQDRDLAATLGRRARALVRERYDWDHLAGRIEEVYHRVMRSRAGSAT